MILIILITILLAAILFRITQSDDGRIFPPGPPGLPLFGNIFEIDQKDARKTWSQWHEQFGPIFCLKAGWDDIIVLGTIPVAKDLYGQKGARYSSRPAMTMAREVMTKNMQTTTLPYGEKWKTHNRIQLSLLSTRMMQKYEKLVQLESRRTLFRLLDAKDLVLCLNRFKFNIIYTLAYAKDPEQNDAEFHEILELADTFAKALTNSIWIVDIFPILNKLPNSFGAMEEVW